MELPPSYEDVLLVDNLAATTETAITPEMADKPYGVLFLRFPDTCVQEFRDTIGGYHQSLAECEGEIIAFAPQVLHDSNEWPARTSVAILKFPSVEVAADWFNKTTGVADPKWLGTCEAIVATMKEQYRKANSIFSLTASRYKLPMQKAKLNKYGKLYPKTLRRLRLLQTGVLLVSSPKFTTLRGSWLEDKRHVTVSQWETMDLYFEFRCKRKTGPFKECFDLLGEVLVIPPAVIFQSEDLSLFQMSSIPTTERSDSPTVEFQSQNTQAQAKSNASGAVASGARQAESTRSESPAVEVQSEDIDNAETQTQCEASGDVNEASGDVNEASGDVNEATGDVNEASGDVNEASGERQAVSTRSDSPAVEVQSEDIDNAETQTQCEASGDGDEAEGGNQEETVDMKSPIVDLQ
ncbi:uncharacterized protein LOC124285688 isoform X2 [Haliotis rubra]|uniref:uncharacterized protein LOC124285688 isoform X2 n=1 Tax=Haliotis rubra TaxID=36100 RepID=UPI001EE5B5E1|nr:uncharacterized protein LOC124285688 isoform X2 [Haliotis rubra]